MKRSERIMYRLFITGIIWIAAAVLGGICWMMNLDPAFYLIIAPMAGISISCCMYADVVDNCLLGEVMRQHSIPKDKTGTLRVYFEVDVHDGKMVNAADRKKYFLLES